MKELLVLALVLGSISSFASETFKGLDNSSKECSVTMTPTATNNISEITITAQGIEMNGEVASSTRVLKLKRIDFLGAERGSRKDLELRARVELEDGRPTFFSIKSEVLLFTPVIVNHYPYPGHWDHTNPFPYERVSYDVKVLSRSMVECNL